MHRFVSGDERELVRLAGRSESVVDNVQACARFMALTSEWGQKTDLVKADTAAELAEVLFLDAFYLAKVIPAGVGDFADIGAGAGAPSIPLLLLRPDLRGRLVEPRRRRVAFMRIAAGALGLVQRCKVEERMMLASTEPAVTVSFSRATFSPPEWLAAAAQFSQYVVLLLGRAEVPTHPDFDLTSHLHYEVPSSGATRSIALLARRAT